MKTIKFEALNWAEQEYDRMLYDFEEYEYCLIPLVADEDLPAELKDLVGKPLRNFVAFDRNEDGEYTFEYNNYKIVVEVFGDWRI